MKIIFVLFLFFTATTLVQASTKPAKLKYSMDFIFSKVLELKGQTLDPNIPFPKFYFESKTPLKVFQDAIEAQWGMRPEVFTNAFAIKSNQIFIIDTAEYYDRNKRCMDDSVVHELVHYIQAKYQGWDLNDESLEWQAIDIQTTFRDLYCQHSAASG